MTGRYELNRYGRRILEALKLAGPQWRVPDAFDDGEALWSAVCDYELEGIVAKRLDEPYMAGERRWLKVKNRAYWRYEPGRHLRLHGSLIGGGYGAAVLKIETYGNNAGTR